MTIGAAKILLAVIVTPIVVLALIANAVLRFFRPESSILLFYALPPHLDQDRFRSAVSAVMNNASVTSTPRGFAARMGSVRLSVECHTDRLNGVSDYKTQDTAAQAAVGGHRGWTSLAVNASRSDQDRARAIAARVCAHLMDGQTSAVWDSKTGVVRAAKPELVASLAAGILN